jgi:hypothetical protein
MVFILYSDWFQQITGLPEDVLRTRIDQQRRRGEGNDEFSAAAIFVPATPDPEFTSWAELGILPSAPLSTPVGVDINLTSANNQGTTTSTTPTTIATCEASTNKNASAIPVVQPI